MRTITARFNKNGRRKGGFDFQSTGFKYLSQLSYNIGWCGHVEPYKMMFSILVEGEQIAFWVFDETSRETLIHKLPNAKKIDIDIDLRKARQEKRDKIARGIYELGDYVKYQDEVGEIVKGQTRVDDKWMVEITMNNVESIQVNMSAVEFVS